MMGSDFKIKSTVVAALMALPFCAQAQVLLNNAGSVTVPPGVFQVSVELSSGSGGGGGWDNTPAGGGIGGSGATVTAIVAVTPGQVITGSIGQGGIGGLSWVSGTGGSPGGSGDGNGGSGGNGNGTGITFNGGGGGGGGATVLTIDTSVIRVGGGGGGGGDSNNYTDPMINGGHANQVGPVVLTNACLTPENGGAGHTDPAKDGGGGGGGGGGYQGAAGSGGASGDEGSQPRLTSTGGAAGGSCAYMQGSNSLIGTPSIAAGPTGGIGGNGTLPISSRPGEDGKPGSILVTAIATPPTPVTTAVPLWSEWMMIITTTMLAGLTWLRRQRRTQTGTASSQSQT